MSVKCIALSFIVEREKLLDSGLFENLKCQASIISSHFCQDCFSFAQMCTPSPELAELALKTPDGPSISRSDSFGDGWGRWFEVVQLSHGSTNLWFLLLLSKIDFSLFCQKCICYICHLPWQTKMPHLNKIGIISSRMTGEGKLKTKQNKAEQFRSSGKPSLLSHVFPLCTINNQNPNAKCSERCHFLLYRNIVFQWQIPHPRLGDERTF